MTQKEIIDIEQENTECPSQGVQDSGARHPLCRLPTVHIGQGSEQAAVFASAKGYGPCTRVTSLIQWPGRIILRGLPGGFPKGCLKGMSRAAASASSSTTLSSGKSSRHRSATESSIIISTISWSRSSSRLSFMIHTPAARERTSRFQEPFQRSSGLRSSHRESHVPTLFEYLPK